MGKRGHHDWSKRCQPVGTIHLRTKFSYRANGSRGPTRKVRYVKVRLTGPKPKRWMPLARYVWEKTHGPVPAGLRVVHLDGNTLNDDPKNYGLLTAGEVIKLYHKLNPAMSEENRRGRRRRQL